MKFFLAKLRYRFWNMILAGLLSEYVFNKWKAAGYAMIAAKE